MRVAQASLFTAEAVTLDLIAAGREKEVQEFRDFIFTIVPDPIPTQIRLKTTHQVL